MMSKTSKGFSILELMIGIAIVGVLAATAFPIYVDYTNRAKVGEALSLMLGVKIPMNDYYMMWSAWPSISEVGGKTAGNYVSILESKIDPPCSTTLGTSSTYVQATMKGDPLSGKKLSIIYIPETRDWICTTACVPPADSIPDKYLPSSCK